MSDEAVSKLKRESEEMKRNRWFDPMRGGYPQIPNVDSLPAASPGLAFCIIGLRDSADDAVYICVKDTGVWTWKSITLA